MLGGVDGWGRGGYTEGAPTQAALSRAAPSIDFSFIGFELR